VFPQILGQGLLDLHAVHVAGRVCAICYLRGLSSRFCAVAILTLCDRTLVYHTSNPSRIFFRFSLLGRNGLSCESGTVLVFCRHNCTSCSYFFRMLYTTYISLRRYFLSVMNASIVLKSILIRFRTFWDDCIRLVVQAVDILQRIVEQGLDSRGYRSWTPYTD
jgi:hypothetical protein